MIETVIYGRAWELLEYQRREKVSNVAIIAISSGDDCFRGIFKPILILDFDCSNPFRFLAPPQTISNAKDQISYKARLAAIIASNPKLPNDSDAQKIINFTSELYKDPSIWTLYIACPTGRRESASIARFLMAMKLEGLSQIKGLNCIDTEWHNVYLSGLLAYNYGKNLEDYIGTLNDTDADSKPTVRGKEDNASI